MKLLEILQKEIKQFPKEMLYAVQDGDGEVKFGKHLKPRLWSDGIWYRRESWDCLCITGLGLAEDWDSAIVTKDMWENGRVKSENSTQKVLEMAEKRKVRADFDKRKEYSVNVSNCTEDEKKKVQQAFFDAGISWELAGKEYRNLHALQYTNTTGDGSVTEHCLYGTTTEDCNMNPDEFFSYVYEPVQQGHIHADLMVMYAEDAKITYKPWELWQFKIVGDEWNDLTSHPMWQPDLEYRRKPKTHIVNGVEVPDLRFVPEGDEEYYTPFPGDPNLYLLTTYFDIKPCRHRVSNNLCYELTEEGKQAAILHAKAWLSIA